MDLNRLLLRFQITLIQLYYIITIRIKVYIHFGKLSVNFEIFVCLKILKNKFKL